MENTESDGTGGSLEKSGEQRWGLTFYIRNLVSPLSCLKTVPPLPFFFPVDIVSQRRLPHQPTEEHHLIFKDMISKKQARLRLPQRLGITRLFPFLSACSSLMRNSRVLPVGGRRSSDSRLRSHFQMRESSTISFWPDNHRVRVAPLCILHLYSLHTRGSREKAADALSSFKGSKLVKVKMMSFTHAPLYGRHLARFHGKMEYVTHVD